VQIAWIVVVAIAIHSGSVAIDVDSNQ